MAVSLLLAIAGVFLLIVSARGGGMWAMFVGLVTLSVGFCGVGSSAASAMDAREPGGLGVRGTTPSTGTPPRRG